MIEIPTVRIGPHGLSEIVYTGHAAPRGPRWVRSQLSSTKPRRRLIVRDIDNKFADAWFDGEDEELPLAKQWLLDMCNVKYGG